LQGLEVSLSIFIISLPLSSIALAELLQHADDLALTGSQILNLAGHMFLGSI